MAATWQRPDRPAAAQPSNEAPDPDVFDASIAADHLDVALTNVARDYPDRPGHRLRGRQV